MCRRALNCPRTENSRETTKAISPNTSSPTTNSSVKAVLKNPHKMPSIRHEFGCWRIESHQTTKMKKINITNKQKVHEDLKKKEAAVSITVCVYKKQNIKEKSCRAKKMETATFSNTQKQTTTKNDFGDAAPLNSRKNVQLCVLIVHQSVVVCHLIVLKKFLFV
jgi:hypothetical protein